MELGRFGVWTSCRAIGEQHLSEAAGFAEQLGYGTFWLGGSPQLPQVRPLLEATERLVAATSIVNVWSYDPGRLAAEFWELEEAFPGRLLVGVGIGHAEATVDYSKPLSAMRSFLDGLDAAERPLPPDRRCIAALAPKMLRLSAERSLGTIPYFTSSAHTRSAREQLGAGPLIAPEIAFALDGDADRARATARGYARLYLGLTNYTNNLLASGFTAEDIAGDGSERLIDSVVPQGGADAIARVVVEHLEAGADHVAVQALGESGIPRAGWSALADALFG
jgi:probable F420-dependent oxidoreductase